MRLLSSISYHFWSEGTDSTDSTDPIALLAAHLSIMIEYDALCKTDLDPIKIFKVLWKEEIERTFSLKEKKAWSAPWRSNSRQR